MAYNHRYHKKEFLLKLLKDPQQLLSWTFEAKKRYGLCILNYIVTSNHIHLLVYDERSQPYTIPKSIQLLAGRTAQAYNTRKKRSGAFWEERYHEIQKPRKRYGLINYHSLMKLLGFRDLDHAVNQVFSAQINI